MGLLAMAVERMRASGLVYVVGADGRISVLTADEYTLLPVEATVGTRAFLTLEQAAAEAAERRARS